MARRRSRQTPVTSPNKIDVVVKRAVAPFSPPPSVVDGPKSSPSLEEMAWREDVWALRTTGAMGEPTQSAVVHPLIVDVWREDVGAGVTQLSLAHWLKQT